MLLLSISLFFFFNDTATTEIYTLSLHDALPIWLPGAPAHVHVAVLLRLRVGHRLREVREIAVAAFRRWIVREDRKSTRLNSSHGYISYAVFCLKKKKKRKTSRALARNTENTTWL